MFPKQMQSLISNAMYVLPYLCGYGKQLPWEIIPTDSTAASASDISFRISEGVCKREDGWWIYLHEVLHFFLWHPQRGREIMRQHPILRHRHVNIVMDILINKMIHDATGSACPKDGLMDTVGTEIERFSVLVRESLEENCSRLATWLQQHQNNQRDDGKQSGDDKSGDDQQSGDQDNSEAGDAGDKQSGSGDGDSDSADDTATSGDKSDDVDGKDDSKQSSSSSGNGAGSGDGADISDADALCDKSDAELSDICNKAADAMDQQGKQPTSADHMVIERLELAPKIDWREFLRNKISGYGETHERSYIRPHRKSVCGVVMPIEYSTAPSKILFIVDNSPSMNQTSVNQGLAIAKEFAMAYASMSVHLAIHNDKLHYCEEFRNDSPYWDGGIKKCGGTEFKCIVEAQQKVEADLVVCITDADGEVDMVDEQAMYDADLVWLVYGRDEWELTSRSDYKYGDVLSIG